MALLCILMLLAASVSNSMQSALSVSVSLSTQAHPERADQSTDDATKDSEPFTHDVTNDPEPFTDEVANDPEPFTDEVTNGTELVFAFMTHRHGQIPPTRLFFPYLVKSDVNGSTPVINHVEELTDVGLTTAFKLGEFIRRRYGQLLSPKYKPSEIYIQTTDVTSTAMTVLTAMEAVYPGNHTCSDKIKWTPVPYTSVPAEIDFMFAPISCAVLKNALLVKLNAPHSMNKSAAEQITNMTNSRMKRFGQLITNISIAIGHNISESPVDVVVLYNAYTELISLGHEVKDKLLPFVPGMKEAADEAYDVLYGDDLYIDFLAGPLLNEFFFYARKIMRGEETQRVRVYSGFEFNIYGLMDISKAEPRQGFPKHGSLFSLELRRVVKTGKYVVLPVYLSEPGVEEIYLTLGGGDKLCDYDGFNNMTLFHQTEHYIWRARCRRPVG